MGPRLASAREVALQVLQRVQKDDSYVNLLLPLLLKQSSLDEADRGLVQELAYGALRWQLQYDAFIDQLAGGKSIETDIRLILRLGMHQLIRMRVPSHAAINESVEQVKRIQPKAAGFANAILRNADRRGFELLLSETTKDKSQLEALSIVHSHPVWIISALADALELDGRGGIEALLESNNETPQINLAALSETAAKKLSGLGLTASPVSPIGFIAAGNPEPLLAGDIRVQDQGSQLVALVMLELANRSGIVLDMCSGPGGKSAVLLSGLNQEAKLVCFEPAPHRARLVANAVGDDKRVSIVTKQGQEAEKNFYDAVLLDAPCTGLGSLRRKPESRWRKQPSQLRDLNRIQRELLAAGLSALKPGGVLLYSTCSPVISETNTQIVDALNAAGDCELVDIKPVLHRLSPTLQLNQNRKTVQLWTDLHQTDCMFLAAIRKN